MIDADRKLFLESIIDAVAERNVVRGCAQPDDLAAAGD